MNINKKICEIFHNYLEIYKDSFSSEEKNFIDGLVNDPNIWSSYFPIISKLRTFIYNNSQFSDEFQIRCNQFFFKYYEIEKYGSKYFAIRPTSRDVAKKSLNINTEKEWKKFFNTFLKLRKHTISEAYNRNIVLYACSKNEALKVIKTHNGTQLMSQVLKKFKFSKNDIKNILLKDRYFYRQGHAFGSSLSEQEYSIHTLLKYQNIDNEILEIIMNLPKLDKMKLIKYIDKHPYKEHKKKMKKMIEKYFENHREEQLLYLLKEGR